MTPIKDYRIKLELPHALSCVVTRYAASAAGACPEDHTVSRTGRQSLSCPIAP